MKNAYKSEPSRKVMSHILTRLSHWDDDSLSTVTRLNGTSITQGSMDCTGSSLLTISQLFRGRSYRGI